MRSYSQPAWVIGIAALLVAASGAATAEARTCTTDAGCPLGFQCLGGGESADGGLVSSCFSFSCQSNSDCGPGLGCYLDMGTECVTAPDGGMSCGPGSACVPQWDAPCIGDTDCGPGFTCSGNTGYYQCGPNQATVVLAPYQTSTTIPCSAVPMPPFHPPLDSGISIPAICEPGSTCLSITQKTCVADKTPPCTVDSDCPATWTCACQMTCGGFNFPETSSDSGESTVEAGCTKVCTPPNSDLVQFVCNGPAGTANGGGVSSPTPIVGIGTDSGTPTEAPDGGGVTPTAIVVEAGTDSGTSVLSGSPAAAGSASHNGGCQIGTGNTATDWTVGAFGVFAWVLRNGARRRRA
jgi:hypothetical protein